MTGQHFKELIETICLTKKIRKMDIARILQVSPKVITYWQANGVPKPRAVRVAAKLRAYCR